MHLLQLIRAAERGELLQSAADEADEVLRQLDERERRRPSHDRIRFAFALSLLHDILSAGGQVLLVDSEIYISWPDWSEVGGREAVRSALSTISPRKPASSEEQRVLAPLFASNWSAEETLEFLTTATFWLEPVDSRHPCGTRYGDAFSVALRLWNMPYRGREGRLRRFVVVGRRKEAQGAPVIVGLIEVGDDAPHSTERDAFLTLRPQEVQRWLRSQASPQRLAAEIAARFRDLRKSLGPIPDVPLDSFHDADDLILREKDLLRRAYGRSKTAENLVVKKRIAYLLRLAHGEITFAKLASGSALSDADRGLREGVRAIHDLTLPRVHMDVTVCGAVPPFSHALGGKLVVAFLAHPEIVSITAGMPGAIVQDLFHPNSIVGLLPACGILVLTTKGLYPSHSALYNRSRVPGHERDLVIRKIGETRGETTTLLSLRSGRLAAHAAEGPRAGVRVSSYYGTGGSKRMRLMESAVVALGLPHAFLHAGIARPVYGVKLAANVEQVIWAGRQPDWEIRNELDGKGYSAAAVSLWRRRWLSQAGNRLASRAGNLPGVLDELGLATAAYTS
jgi:hypothetical protein